MLTVWFYLHETLENSTNLQWQKDKWLGSEVEGTGGIGCKNYKLGEGKIGNVGHAYHLDCSDGFPSRDIYQNLPSCIL